MSDVNELKKSNPKITSGKNTSRRMDWLLADTATHLAAVHGTCKMKSGEGTCRINLKGNNGERIRIKHDIYHSNNEPYQQLYETVVSVKKGILGGYITVMDHLGPKPYITGPGIRKRGSWEEVLLGADKKIYEKT